MKGSAVPRSADVAQTSWSSALRPDAPEEHGIHLSFATEGVRQDCPEDLGSYPTRLLFQPRSPDVFDAGNEGSGVLHSWVSLQDAGDFNLTKSVIPEPQPSQAQSTEGREATPSSGSRICYVPSTCLDGAGRVKANIPSTFPVLTAGTNNPGFLQRNWFPLQCLEVLEDRFVTDYAVPRVLGHVHYSWLFDDFVVRTYCEPASVYRKLLSALSSNRPSTVSEDLSTLVRRTGFALVLKSLSEVKKEFNTPDLRSKLKTVFQKTLEDVCLKIFNMRVENKPAGTKRTSHSSACSKARRCLYACLCRAATEAARSALQALGKSSRTVSKSHSHGEKSVVSYSFHQSIDAMGALAHDQNAAEAVTHAHDSRLNMDDQTGPSSRSLSIDATGAQASLEKLKRAGIRKAENKRSARATAERDNKNLISEEKLVWHVLGEIVEYSSAVTMQA